MDLKDFVTVTLSAGAICVSIIAFVFTFRQRGIENLRSIRKALTDVIAELTKVNIAVAQLDLDHPGSRDGRVVSLRRSYNDQRRYLANHGEFLSQEGPGLLTDIDCLVIAHAFTTAGDYIRAEKFYNLGVERSPNNVIRLNTLRGLARFWFQRGNAARGRKLYEEALQLDLPDTDSVRQHVADTYFVWARVERDAGFDAESRRVQKLAEDAARRIGQKNMREEMLEMIDAAFTGSPVPVSSPSNLDDLAKAGDRDRHSKDNSIA
jgi:tetratricopeptide (TPR) repeat protein